MTENPPPSDPYGTSGSQPPPPPHNPYSTPAGSTPPSQPPQQPPPPAGPGSPYGGSPAQSTDAAGFFKALFDFSFSNFITPKVVKFVYVLSTILLGLIWLIWLLAAFASDSAAIGIFVLLIGPLIFLVYLAIIRMTLEFYLAIVRMSEDIHHRLPPR